MKLTIDGTAKEIADFIVSMQTTKEITEFIPSFSVSLSPTDADIRKDIDKVVREQKRSQSSC